MLVAGSSGPGGYMVPAPPVNGIQVMVEGYPSGWQPGIQSTPGAIPTPPVGMVPIDAGSINVPVPEGSRDSGILVDAYEGLSEEISRAEASGKDPSSVGARTASRLISRYRLNPAVASRIVAQVLEKDFGVNPRGTTRELLRRASGLR